MGKHVPLPSDPTMRAAEKRRRFALYHRGSRKRQRAMARAKGAAEGISRRKLQQAALRAGVDLCVSSLHDMTTAQLKRALAFVANL
jgi:hypothetical protein